ncbi:MAG: polymer-forming cytoskeletal protein [Spirochaetaceae bacterium]|nr:polymer-forming cytoskeletal protein [Spirochaetaceae bacterium]
MAEIHAKKIYEKNVDTILTEDIHFSGELSFSKALIIKGQFTGVINATGDLYIEEKAHVEAEITASSVFVKGRVIGNIQANKRVELNGSASVQGDITSPRIVMDTGCRFDGISKMKRSEK